MHFPPCPICEKGQLLPLSLNDEAFSYWVCSQPACNYCISGNTAAVTYHKGSAVREEKARNEKRWTQYEF